MTSAFRYLVHPLQQVQAAEAFYDQVKSYVDDEWPEDDTRPDEEELQEAISPAELLGTLQKLGLRFDLAAPPPPDGVFDYDDGYWNVTAGNSLVDYHLRAWRDQVMVETGLDVRAFERGLIYTGLVFVPDDCQLVDRAWRLALTAMAGA